MQHSTQQVTSKIQASEIVSEQHDLSLEELAQICGGRLEQGVSPVLSVLHLTSVVCSG